METRLTSCNLKGRQITVQLWRAVKGAPAGLSKGSMGHGLYDMISNPEPGPRTRTRTRAVTLPVTRCDKISRSSSLPTLTADKAVLAREALQVVSSKQ